MGGYPVETNYLLGGGGTINVSISTEGSGTPTTIPKNDFPVVYGLEVGDYTLLVWSTLKKGNLRGFHAPVNVCWK